MACSPCARIRRLLGLAGADAVQLAENEALLADLVLNTETGGRPTETVSRRVARARRDGTGWRKPAATALCAFLTLAANLLLRLRGQPGQDHCTYALDDRQPSIAREVVHLSPPEAG